MLNGLDDNLTGLCYSFLQTDFGAPPSTVCPLAPTETTSTEATTTTEMTTTKATTTQETTTTVVTTTEPTTTVASDYGFIVSNASTDGERLCITATHVDFGTLRLVPCDYAWEEQLWKLEGNKFYNGLGKDYCMTVNHGQALFDGVKMRLAGCNDSALTEFTYDGEYIKVVESDGLYCITSRGTSANAGDSLLAKPCRDRSDFKWTFTADDSENTGTLHQFHAHGGCVQPKNGSTVKFTEIILDECDESYAWNGMVVADGAVIFRSRLDLNMCLQAGSGGDPRHGTKMRLMPCNDNEENQKFEWSDGAPIKLASRNDLCMEWRGNTASVGIDPIIMKTCDGTEYEWSGDNI